jgi:hypothetical protein
MLFDTIMTFQKCSLGNMMKEDKCISKINKTCFLNMLANEHVLNHTCCAGYIKVSFQRGHY